MLRSTTDTHNSVGKQAKRDLHTRLAYTMQTGEWNRTLC